ncbi:hypothetical protein PMAYCL1PPCAC_13020 [Pristionchus mayeri]|uniref:ubiquitinyl hydrolase 1 n=1 Tax=Pristionchus mayeri TaxID=1317129 RepID=A0AAN4ZTD1_9BILA|nr:hypothetical protein PMAYCL1PPCAC_13020 [Pristionchus mayeri]
MTLNEQREIAAQVVIKRRKNADSTSPRPAIITATPGFISIKSTEGKFLPVKFKVDSVIKFKRPKGANTKWATLDFIQNIDAKFTWINIQVREASEMDELVDVINFAWDSRPEISLFADNADEIPAPVHKPPPNATKPSVAPPIGRDARRKVKVDDEEDRNCHGGFDNDFRSSSAASRKAPQKTDQLKRLFVENAEEKALPVHKNPHAIKQSRLPDCLRAKSDAVESKPKGLINKILKEGDEVGKQSSIHEEKKRLPPLNLSSTTAPSIAMERSPKESFDGKRSEGIGDRSFYGSQKPSMIPVKKRMGTKDSLDASRSRPAARCVVTPGIPEVRLEEEDDCDNSDLPSSYQPIVGHAERREEKKSLTDPAAARLFDDLKKKSSNSNLSRDNERSSNNPPYRSPLINRQVSTDRSTSYTEGWMYKKQENIGNSCYMNSTMQVLAACPLFVEQMGEAYSSLKERKGWDRISDTFKCFRNLMYWLAGKTPRGAVPTSMLEKMRRQIMTLDAIFEEMGGRAQQDAEECLTAILGAISDECTGKGFRKRDSLSRRSLGGVSPVKRTDPETGSSQFGSQSGEGEKREKPACLDPVDLLEVKMRDVKRCNSCGDTNHKDAMEHRVHLVVEEEERRYRPWTVKCVQQLLAAEIAQEETIGDFNCEKCPVKSTATGTKQFVQFGEYIIIVLKRFGYDENQRLRKLNTPIRVPLYLEAADLTGGERTRETGDHDVTIVLHDELQKTQWKNRKETLKVASPAVKVMEKTNEWVDNEDANTQVTQSGEYDSFFDNDGGGDKMEDTEEGGWVKEEEIEEDGEGEKTAGKDDVTEIIEIGSQPDCLETAEGLATGDEEIPPPISTPVETPPTSRVRMETPVTVQGEKKRRSEGNRGTMTTPSRKRGRQRTSTGNEGTSEKRLSSGSLSSLSYSAPSKSEKKSRLEGKRRSSEQMSPMYTARSSVDEVTIVDDDDEEEKKSRRLSTESKTPCWAVTEEKKEKRKSTDVYDFDDDEVEKEAGPANWKKRPTKGFVPPVRSKRPLSNVNGPPQESPVKGDNRRKKQKAENIDPSPIKMEQKGGGKRKEETEEDTQATEEGKERMRNGEGMEKERNDLPDNVTRRSKAREMRRRTGEGKGEEERSTCGEKSEEREEMEEVREDEEGSIMSRGSKDEEEGSSEEVVQETPPEEIEEGEENEKEGGDVKEDEEKNTEGIGAEEEEKEEELFEDEEEGEIEKREEAPVTDEECLIGEAEAAVFDTPKVGLQSQDYDMDRIEPTEEDGEVRLPPMHLPNLSPVKKKEEGEVQEEKEEENDLEIIENEKEKKEERKKEKDEYRANWRKLFIDTDPPPLRDHFAFRPVDDRWMRGQCKMLGLESAVDNGSEHPNVFKKLRAQSNLCKISAEPRLADIKDIDGDGNCLFRSLSWWVTGSEESHEQMRQQIVNFMCKFPDDFGSRMSGNGKKYTKESNDRMFELGEWGTHCEIYGAATLLGVDIYTYHEKRWKPYRPLFDWTAVGGHKVTRKTGVNERTRFGIYLSNPENFHYDVVTYMEPEVPVSGTSYRLLGTILHRGATACSGHYVADVYDQEKKQWIHCDDEKIKERSVIEVLMNAMDEGYVLVYGKNEGKKGMERVD